jgi:hypothetical protein
VERPQPSYAAAAAAAAAGKMMDLEQRIIEATKFSTVVAQQLERPT